MSDPEKPLGWGRVFAAARLSHAPETRRGAWYRVLSEGRSRIVLEVRGKRVDLSKGAVEVRPVLPDKFTVVYRAADEPTPARQTAGDLGRVYAVCPRCARRSRLFGEPRTLQCKQCHHEGEIAWWETG